ncbi:MAG: hypothetical protein MUO77_03245 [Anaerolineales bacterium]|nr:hypothetical protein [Anaerolineales bacterium]
MPRRTILNNTDSTNDQSDTVATIPTVQKKRHRKWEKKNPTTSFRIPPDIAERVVAPINGLRNILITIANHEVVLLDEITLFFTEYGLTCFERGDFQLEGRPDASTNRRKMKLVGWKEGDGWPVELSTKPRKKEQSQATKVEGKIYTLAYRWGVKAEALQIRLDAISEQYCLPVGEVLVRILEHSAAMYKAGKMTLEKDQPAITNQVKNWKEKS